MTSCHNKKIFSLVAILSLMFTIILAAGCFGIPDGRSSSPALQPDPETGLVYWIMAVNDKDIHRLYELSPGFIRSNLTEQAFTAANQDNPILKPGFGFVNYEVMNRTSDGDTATIRAMLVTNQEGTANTTGNIPVFYNFILFYEDGEWKVWTAPF